MNVPGKTKLPKPNPSKVKDPDERLFARKNFIDGEVSVVTAANNKLILVAADNMSEVGE